MNKGLIAAVILDNNIEADKVLEETVAEEEMFEDVDEDFNYQYNLPPDIALIGYSNRDPKTLDEALHGPNAKEWQEALDYEICQLEKLGTWIIQDLPPGQMAIPCSEVVRVKRGPTGEIQSYRVRIVARGHRQVKSVNYTKTFSTAAKMPMVHVVLTNAAHQDWGMEHIDVKSAYLNTPLKEEIYMQPPRGVLKPGQEGKVLTDVKRFWDITNHGPIKWFLGFQIRRDQKTRTVSINQQAYIKSVIEKSRLTGAKLISMPMDPNAHCHLIKLKE